MMVVKTFGRHVATPLVDMWLFVAIWQLTNCPAWSKCKKRRSCVFCHGHQIIVTFGRHFATPLVDVLPHDILVQFDYSFWSHCVGATRAPRQFAVLNRPQFDHWRLSDIFKHTCARTQHNHLKSSTVHNCSSCFSCQIRNQHVWKPKWPSSQHCATAGSQLAEVVTTKHVILLCDVC